MCNSKNDGSPVPADDPSSAENYPSKDNERNSYFSMGSSGVQSLPKLLRPAEVARILAISKTSCYRLLQDGDLPGVRFGGSTVRVKLDDLQRFIEAHNDSRPT